MSTSKEITITVRGTIDFDRVPVPKGRDGKPLRLRKSQLAKIHDEATGKALAVVSEEGRALLDGLRKAGVDVSHASATIGQKVAQGLHQPPVVQSENLLEDEGPEETEEDPAPPIPPSPPTPPA